MATTDQAIARMRLHTKHFINVMALWDGIYTYIKRYYSFIKIHIDTFLQNQSLSTLPKVT